MSSFKVNIQIKPKATITLGTLCDKTTIMYDLKRIIVDSQQLNSADNIGLKYKDAFMDDNNTLEYYGITDSRHIIKLFFNVQGANKSNYPPKQYSYISDNNVSSDDIKVPLNSFFTVNIQINSSAIIPLNTLCDKTTSIHDIKRIIVNE